MANLHLGFRLDASGKPGADRLVVESGDLTTHGAILGMTGSGKTGLGVVLIEEALLAGIPCLVLDPKGDMGNLLLTFPELDAASFRPWVNEDDARSEGVSLDDYAQRTATIWRKGLEAPASVPTGSARSETRRTSPSTRQAPGPGSRSTSSARCERPSSRGTPRPRRSATRSRAP